MNFKIGFVYGRTAQDRTFIHSNCWNRPPFHQSASTYYEINFYLSKKKFGHNVNRRIMFIQFCLLLIHLEA